MTPAIAESGLPELPINHYSDVYADLEAQFSGHALPLSFRAVVGPLPADHLTHSIYPYPARLLRHIPRFFLGCKQITGGDRVRVYDPFCGSGTVPLEALHMGHRAAGADINPFASMLTRVKCTPLSQSQQDALRAWVGAARRLRRGADLPTKRLEYWHGPASLIVLQKLLRALSTTTGDDSAFFAAAVSLACIANNLSLRDHRIPVPVRKAPAGRPVSVKEAWAIAEKTVDELLHRLASLPDGMTSRFEGSFRRDARDMTAGQYDVILTSPPYGAAQKYARATSIPLMWLSDLMRLPSVPDIERKTIGREHISRDEANAWPSIIAGSYERDVMHSLSQIAGDRPAIYAHYFAEMRESIHNMASSLAPGGKLILVAAANRSGGQTIPTHEILARHAEAEGLKRALHLVDRIAGRHLLTRRAQSSGEPIHEEHVYVFTT